MVDGEKETTNVVMGVQKKFESLSEMSDDFLNIFRILDNFLGIQNILKSSSLSFLIIIFSNIRFTIRSDIQNFIFG